MTMGTPATVTVQYECDIGHSWEDLFYDLGSVDSEQECPETCGTCDDCDCEGPCDDCNNCGCDGDCEEEEEEEEEDLQLAELKRQYPLAV